MLNCKVMYPKGGLICLEHINPRSSTERRSTASEREWQQPTVEKYWQEEELKVEKGCLTKEKATLMQWSFLFVAAF